MDRYVGLDAHAKTCTLAVHVSLGQATQVDGGGDERACPGGRGEGHCRGRSSVSRGGDAERVAPRDSVSPHVRAGGERSGEEARGEGRPSRRVVASGRHPGGASADASVQGSEAPGGSAQRGVRVSSGDAGRGADEESSQGGVSLAGDSVGRRGLRAGVARPVAEAAPVGLSGARVRGSGRNWTGSFPCGTRRRSGFGRRRSLIRSSGSFGRARGWARSARRSWWRSWGRRIDSGRGVSSGATAVWRW